jgi:hypothetical protein
MNDAIMLQPADATPPAPDYGAGDDVAAASTPLWPLLALVLLLALLARPGKPQRD